MDVKFGDERLPSRIWNRTIANGQTGCWEWHGSKRYGGYGRTRVGAEQIQVHRAAYIAFCGPIPDGLVIDHLCNVRLCLNPAHLEAVTIGENNLRARLRKPERRMCSKGHEINDRDFAKNATGYRRCRICRRELERGRRQAEKQAAPPTSMEIEK